MRAGSAFATRARAQPSAQQAAKRSAKQGGSRRLSRAAAPLLYVTSEEGTLSVMDPETGKVLRTLDKLGRTALAAVVGF